MGSLTVCVTSAWGDIDFGLMPEPSGEYAARLAAHQCHVHDHTAQNPAVLSEASSTI